MEVLAELLPLWMERGVVPKLGLRGQMVMPFHQEVGEVQIPLQLEQVGQAQLP